MAIDPVKIPQNVYIEDRIVGPLTLRQTLITTVGGGISYALYALVSKGNGGHAPNFILTGIAWTPLVIAAAFAFIRVNDLSLARLLMLTMERLNKPAIRTWNPRRGLVINFKTNTTELAAQIAVPQANRVQAQSKIRELSSFADRGMNVADSAPVSTYEEPAPIAEEPEEETVEVYAASEAAPELPVNPSRISTDKPANGQTLSDLSVFRDIFQNPHA